MRLREMMTPAVPEQKRANSATALLGSHSFNTLPLGAQATETILLAGSTLKLALTRAPVWMGAHAHTLASRPLGWRAPGDEDGSAVTQDLCGRSQLPTGNLPPQQQMSCSMGEGGETHSPLALFSWKLLEKSQATIPACQEVSHTHVTTPCSHQHPGQCFITHSQAANRPGNGKLAGALGAAPCSSSPEGWWGGHSFLPACPLQSCHSLCLAGAQLATSWPWTGPSSVPAGVLGSFSSSSSPAVTT